MPNANDFRPADWSVVGTSGVLFVLSLLALLYALPWKASWRQVDFLLNRLWPTRSLLMAMVAGTAAVQVAHLYSLLWNPGSPISPAKVTNFTVQGWLCRIYLVASLGVFIPLSLWLAIFSIASGRRGIIASKLQKQLEGWDSTTCPSNMRIFVFSFVCTLPIAVLQAVVAFVGVGARSEGETFEEQPRSVLGFFFATFWEGTGSQCSPSADSDQDCILCVFPAASVIIHCLFSLVALYLLWVSSWKLANDALNRSVRRRLRRFVTIFTIFTLTGCGAMGASIAWGPFSWVNQGLWLGYFATVFGMGLLLVQEIVFWPVRSLHMAAKAARSNFIIHGGYPIHPSQDLDYDLPMAPSAPPIIDRPVNGYYTHNNDEYDNTWTNGNQRRSAQATGGMQRTANDTRHEYLIAHPFALEEPNLTETIQDTDTPSRSSAHGFEDMNVYPAAAAAMLDPSGVYREPDSGSTPGISPSHRGSFRSPNTVVAERTPDSTIDSISSLHSLETTRERRSIATPARTARRPSSRSPAVVHRREGSYGMMYGKFSPWHGLAGSFPVYGTGTGRESEDDSRGP